MLVSLCVNRLKGDYLAIVTLAFGEIIRSIIINLKFTGGASGLKGTPQDTTFINSFIVVMITIFIMQNITNSKFGRAIASIRDNQIASQACGVDTSKYKLLTFIFAAFFRRCRSIIFT